MGSWFRTAPLVAKLAGDFIGALNTEAVKERFKKLGGSPRQFTEKIQADYDKWDPSSRLLA